MMWDTRAHRLLKLGPVSSQVGGRRRQREPGTLFFHETLFGPSPLSSPNPPLGLHSALPPLISPPGTVSSPYLHAHAHGLPPMHMPTFAHTPSAQPLHIQTQTPAALAQSHALALKHKRSVSSLPVTSSHSISFAHPSAQTPPLGLDKDSKETPSKARERDSVVSGVDEKKEIKENEQTPRRPAAQERPTSLMPSVASPRSPRLSPLPGSPARKHVPVANGPLTINTISSPLLARERSLADRLPLKAQAAALSAQWSAYQQAQARLRELRERPRERVTSAEPAMRCARAVVFSPVCRFAVHFCLTRSCLPGRFAHRRRHNRWPGLCFLDCHCLSRVCSWWSWTLRS